MRGSKIPELIINEHMDVYPKEVPQDQGFKATKSFKMLLQRTVNWLIPPIEPVWNPFRSHPL